MDFCGPPDLDVILFLLPCRPRLPFLLGRRHWFFLRGFVGSSFSLVAFSLERITLFHQWIGLRSATPDQAQAKRLTWLRVC
jgi:hypothetical protein